MPNLRILLRAKQPCADLRGSPRRTFYDLSKSVSGVLEGYRDCHCLTEERTIAIRMPSVAHGYLTDEG